MGGEFNPPTHLLVSGEALLLFSHFHFCVPSPLAAEKEVALVFLPVSKKGLRVYPPSPPLTIVVSHFHLYVASPLVAEEEVALGMRLPPPPLPPLLSGVNPSNTNVNVRKPQDEWGL